MISLKAASDIKPWQWAVCLLLLSATMINYMDRQTLSNLSPRIMDQFKLNGRQYGNLEQIFGITFAYGSLFWGSLVDLVPVRLLYPVVLIAWSAVGFATGLSNGYDSLFYCRAALGFFEAGHWPCALVVTQAILTSSQRPLGNSILQSGASIGAIITPQIIALMVPAVVAGATLTPDVWRPPFLVIGAVGLVWVAVWFSVVNKDTIQQPSIATTKPQTSLRTFFLELLFSRKFWALVLMVVSINTTWQMLRAWMPLFLQKGRGYSEWVSLQFTSAYYLSTDVGCLLAGAATLWLAGRGAGTASSNTSRTGGMSVHTARLIVYGCCASIAALTLVAARLPASPALLLLLLLVGAGTLGLFPCYYSFTQEIDAKRMGKVTGILSFLSWIVSAPVHPWFGSIVDKTGSYDLGIAVIGCVPMIGLSAMLLLWPSQPDAVVEDSQA